MLFAEFCSRFVYPSTEPTGQLSTVSSEGGEICPKYDYCFKPIFLKKITLSPQKIGKRKKPAN